jgi:CHAT domain-containing protein
MYAIWHLERGKALSALELASVNEYDRRTVEKWIESSHDWAVLEQLKRISRPLTISEQEEFNGLNARYETLIWSRYRMPIGNVEELLVWPSTTLFDTIPDDSLVIYANASQDGLAVFCIHSEGVLDAKYHENATSELLSTTAYEFISRVRLEHQNADMNDLMNSALIPLSIQLIKPFERHIKLKKHIIFVPTASLSQFPVGTLIYPVPEDRADLPPMTGDEYLGVQKAVSQIPSLSFYHYLRNRDINKPKALTTCIVARAGSLREEMLGGEAALPLAGIEALFISQLVGKPVLRAEQQTKAAFLNQLEEHGIMHIATHGYLDHQAPLLSRISLGEDTRVVDMMKARTKASLVIFSACNTAAGLPSSSDDVVGFPYAVLAAGANAFLGSLWATNDLSTLVHMHHFYTLLLLMHRAETLAYTWFRATRMLFYSTTDQVAKMLQTLLDMWDEWEAKGIQPETIVKRGKKELQAAIKSLRSIDGNPMINWKHPYIWASFMMVGNGDIERKLTEWQREFQRLRDASRESGEELTTESELRIYQELRKMNLSTTTTSEISGS